MKLLDRYIGRAVLMGAVLSMMILLSLLSFINIVDELNDVGKGTYGVADAFTYVALTAPRNFYDLFPVAALLGGLIGLGGMASSSELVAMRAAGVSIARIVFSVMKTGLIMMLIVIVVGEVVAPYTEQTAQTLRAQAQTEKITLKTQYGFWARDGASFVNIREIHPGGKLVDITIYELDDRLQLAVATHAQTAYYHQDSWILNGITETRFADDRIETRARDRATWSSLLDPKLLSVVVVKPEILPVWGLYRYISFLKTNSQDARLYEVAFWGKVVRPAVTLVMLFVAIPFVFGSVRSISAGQRIFYGSMVGVSFFLFNKAFSYMAVVYALDPLFSAAFPALVVLSIAFWFGRRVV